MFHDSDKPGTEVHIFPDSNTTMKNLVEPGKISKYYRLVQKTRRMAALFKNYKFVMHWIPSHLEDTWMDFKIHGNSSADKEAERAALKGRKNKYIHHEGGLDDLGVHKAIMNESARLVHEIELLFREHGPASPETCEVAALTPVCAVKPSGAGVT